MRKINNLNEEIARWAFEILFRNNKTWKIAFTNPTAGPWKTIKALAKETEKEGEVYRFNLEEERPDIIMYNDDLETVIIIEAKDSLNKLIKNSQAEKSAAVVVELGSILQSKRDNYYWKGREHYRIILGLLWGCTDKREKENTRNYLFDYYHKLVEREKVVFSDIIIGVETLYKDENLQCKSYFKSYNSQMITFGDQLIKSLIEL